MVSLSQSFRHFIGQRRNPGADLLFPYDITAKSHSVADGFRRRTVIIGAHRLLIQPVGVPPERIPYLAQPRRHQLTIRGGKIADGHDSKAPECFRRFPPGKQHVADRQRIREGAVMLPIHHGGRVRLFVVAPQLCKHPAEADPDRNGNADLLPHPRTKHVRQLAGGHGKQVHAPRKVEKGFVNPERVHKIGIIQINSVDPLGDLGIFAVMRGHAHKIRAFFFRLENGFGSLHPRRLGKLVFRQHNAMAVFGVTGHRHRHPCQRRIGKRFHRGKKRIAVTMQNHAIHPAPPFFLSLYPLFLSPSSRFS